MNTTTLRRAAAVTALVAGFTAATAGSAQAVVRDTDPFKIATQWGKADFGSGAHVLGAPKYPGLLSWDESSDGRTVTAKLTGRVYWDDVTSGGCARVRMRLYNTSGALSGTVYSAAACRAGGWTGDVTSRSVNMSRASETANKVVVTTQKAPGPGGDYVNVGSVTRYWGEVNGLD